MQELEKILEEIKEMLEDNKVIELNSDGTIDKCIIDAKLAWDYINDIIRKYMSGKDSSVPDNDGWILVEERMPTQEECKDNLFWITYGSFSSSSRVAQCQWVFSYDENGNDDSYSEFYIDQSPCIYTPSQNLVKAWKIIDIPEPYRTERSKGE